MVEVNNGEGLVIKGKEPGRRVLFMGYGFFEGMLTLGRGMFFRMLSTLPRDARLCGVQHVARRQGFECVFQSMEWEPAGTGVELEELPPVSVQALRPMPAPGAMVVPGVQSKNGGNGDGKVPPGPGEKAPLV